MKKHIIAVIILILAALSALILYLDNNLVTLTKITVTINDLPESFKGFRIAQVSDLHNASFGDSNKRLIAVLKKSKPDIIVITGDLIDARKTDTEVALKFVESAVGIAPVYFVTGNHELQAKEAYKNLKTQMIASGAISLSDEKTYIERENEKIALIGINDCSSAADLDQKLTGLMDDDGTYHILLSHRPEHFDVYSACGLNVAFTGHTHGGQIRLPFIGGLFAPGQGYFPKYDAGLYKNGDFNMIVSRGLGNSSFPLRVNNFPEVIIAQLETSE